MGSTVQQEEEGKVRMAMDLAAGEVLLLRCVVDNWSLLLTLEDELAG